MEWKTMKEQMPEEGKWIIIAFKWDDGFYITDNGWRYEILQYINGQLKKSSFTSWRIDEKIHWKYINHP